MAKRKRFSKHIYDRNTCELCGSTNNTNVHHKDLNATNNSGDNAVVLCGNCHKSIHRWERKIDQLSIEMQYQEFIKKAYEQLYDVKGGLG